MRILEGARRLGMTVLNSDDRFEHQVSEEPRIHPSTASAETVASELVVTAISEALTDSRILSESHPVSDYGSDENQENLESEPT